MQQALQWLLVNNRYYRALGVTIDPTSLAQLPQDGNVSHLVSVTEACSSVDNSSTAEIPAADNQNHTDEDDDHLPRSFIPVAAPSMTEQEAVQQHHLPASTPSIGGVPLNEFTTDGYFTCAFPTLFPIGAGDFLRQRPVQVTIGNYFKYLMLYDNGCFARHP